MNSKDKGDISEAAIKLAFLKLGIPVAVPFGDNQSYDLIIEENGIFKSVQVKTGKLVNGVIRATICNSINTKNLSKEKQIKESYKGKVDYIAIYCLDLDECYLLNPDNFGDRGVYLRVEPPKNNQVKDIHWAKDYKLGK